MSIARLTVAMKARQKQMDCLGGGDANEWNGCNACYFTVLLLIQYIYTLLCYNTFESNLYFL